MALAACSDVGLHSGAPPPGAVEEEVPGVHEDSVGPEPCDGADNDLDGRVDPGYPDTDGDGWADCIDLTCEIDAEEAGTTTAATACEQTTWEPHPDPWQIEQVWQIDPDDPDAPISGCYSVAVADLDGDGVGEIACSTNFYAEDYPNLYVFDGMTGEEEWVTDEVPPDSPLAAADLDGDGDFELIAMDFSGRPIAYSGYDEVLWRASDSLGSFPRYNDVPTYLVAIDYALADVNHDGIVDVVSHHGVVSGADGALIRPLDTGKDAGAYQRDVAVGDLDLDGVVDIVDRCRLWSASEAEPVWESEACLAYDDDRVTPLILQADEDEEGEVAWMDRYSVFVVDTDGTALLDLPLTTQSWGCSKMCAADLDGDGISEIIWPDSEVLRAHHADGTELWTTPIDDPSTGNSCTVYDLDGDGRVEVLLGDQSVLGIYDGLTGALLASAPRISQTVYDQVIPVDLDGDGSVELVATDGWYTFYPDFMPLRLAVYRHPDAGWTPGVLSYRPFTTYSGVGFHADGTVQDEVSPSWLDPGLFRGMGPFPEPTEFDLQVEVADACVASCELEEADVRVALRVANPGPAEAEELTVDVYLLDEDGEPTFDRTLGWSDLHAGTTTPTAELSWTLAEVRHGVEFVVDGGTDCEPADNTLTWRPPCAD